MLFFAALRERVGAREAIWVVPDGMDVAGLRQEAVRRHPDARARLIKGP